MAPTAEISNCGTGGVLSGIGRQQQQYSASDENCNSKQPIVKQVKHVREITPVNFATKMQLKVE